MFMGIEIGGDIMRDAQFIANGSDTGLSLSDYRNWFARNQRLGTLKSSVVDYCVGKLLTGLETPYGALYRVGSEDMQLSDDGIRVDLRWTDWLACTNRSVRDSVSFPLRFGSWPAVVIFGLRDSAERWHPVLDLDAWDFYSVSGRIMSEAYMGADRISLPALLSLGPVWSDYNGIPDAIQQSMGA